MVSVGASLVSHNVPIVPQRVGAKQRSALANGIRPLAGTVGTIWDIEAIIGRRPKGRNSPQSPKRLRAESPASNSVGQRPTGKCGRRPKALTGLMRHM